MLEQVADQIQSLISLIVPKSFSGEFPSLSEEGVAVRLFEGEGAVSYFSSTPTTPTVNFYRPTLLIVARGKDYAITLDWLSDIRVAIDGYRSSSLGIRLQSPPVYLGRDDQKLHEFQVTYKTLVKE